MVLKKTVRSSLVKQVVDQLAQRIESGTWPVGGRIPAEPDLVQQLGVSRNTVREAVQALIHSGMLEARQGDGTYVRSASEFGAAMQRRLQRSTVAEILEVRSGLEREIVRLAALHRTEDEIEVIRDRLAQTIQTSTDTKAHVEADVALHMSIAAATHNSVMIDLYRHMTESLHLSISSTLDLPGHMEKQSKIHIDLVEAIANQDPDAAEEASRTLIQNNQAALRQLIQEGRFQS